MVSLHLRPDEMEIRFQCMKPHTQKPAFFEVQDLQLFELHFCRVGDSSYRLGMASIHEHAMKRENARIRTNRETSYELNL